jgi:hypothetical protein
MLRTIHLGHFETIALIVTAGLPSKAGAFGRDRGHMYGPAARRSRKLRRADARGSDGAPVPRNYY